MIFSDSWERHLHHICEVFDQLRAGGLTAKPRKCEFGMAQCIYLGHVVGNGLVCPKPSKIDAVMSFPISQTKKQVPAFLGVTGYHRKFIPDFASVVAPLTHLIRKNCPDRVVWTPECESAFLKLKNRLCSDPVLISRDFTRLFVLQTDASE